jgi:hypothetical protein
MHQLHGVSSRISVVMLRLSRRSRSRCCLDSSSRPPYRFCVPPPSQPRLKVRLPMLQASLPALACDLFGGFSRLRRLRRLRVALSDLRLQQAQVDSRSTSQLRSDSHCDSPRQLNGRVRIKLA